MAEKAVLVTANDRKRARRMASEEQARKDRRLKEVNKAAIRIQCAHRQRRARQVVAVLRYEGRSAKVIREERSAVWLEQRRGMRRPGFGVGHGKELTNLGLSAAPDERWKGAVVPPSVATAERKRYCQERKCYPWLSHRASASRSLAGVSPVVVTAARLDSPPWVVRALSPKLVVVRPTVTPVPTLPVPPATIPTGKLAPTTVHGQASVQSDCDTAAGASSSPNITPKHTPKQVAAIVLDDDEARGSSAHSVSSPSLLEAATAHARRASKELMRSVRRFSKEASRLLDDLLSA